MDYENPKKITIKHFKTNKFWNRPTDPYYKVDVGMSKPNLDGAKIMTFGFINNDKFNDLVTTDQNQQSLSVHFFDSDTWKYHPTINFTVDPDAKDMVIVSVMIGKDKLDYQSLIVSYYKNKEDTHLTLKIFRYTSKAFEEFKTSTLNNMKIYNGV